MKKAKAKSWFLDILYFIVGGGLYAVSINYFTAPNQIAPGGASGIATLINFIFHTPIGTVILLLNIPLFIWGVIQSGFGFVAKTVVATVINTVMIDISALYLPAYTGDKVLAALFGGLLSGAGLGLVFMRGATTGGSDMAATLLTRHIRFISLGKLILLIDFVVIGASAVVYGNIESALYAVIAIFVSSHVIDLMLYGLGEGNGKMLFIFSEKYQEISDDIMEKIGHGVTLLQSKGGYSGNEGYTIMCAVHRSEVYRVRDIVKEIDSQAFIVVGTAEEIAGEGFLPLAKKEKH